MTRPARNFLAVLTLFFTAPLVAEFLLGNLSLKLLPALVVLAPGYGGGALLIRETARRAGRGWPTMLVLGAAYALLEEGFMTQSLFNPDYLRLHLHLLEHGWIAALGIGAWWTMFMLNLHAFWSMGVSIALVEGLFAADAEAPWLGWIGDAVVGLVFLLGSVAVGRYTVRTEHFVASHTQFLWTAAVCLGLIGLAFLLPRRFGRDLAGPGLSPWVTGGGAFLLGMAVLVTPTFWNWGAAGALVAIDVVFMVGLAWLSRKGWTAMHTFSVGAGGALAYGVHAFFGAPVDRSNWTLVRGGNVIFLMLALGVIALGARRVRRTLESGKL